MSGATFSGNHVTGVEGIGGGLALTSLGLLANSTFVANGATGTGNTGGGGAIFDTTGAVISDCTLSQNAANTNGGGILTSGTENVIGTAITGNKVTAAALINGGGGGIFSEAGIEVENSTISNNTVTVSGAGSSGGGGIYNGGGITLAQSTISGNAVLGSAPSSGGGGFYDVSTASLTNVTISGNSSSLDGGGIDIGANTGVFLANVTLYKNAATGTGGNINNPFSMILSNSIVAGGTAATAPDIKNGGTITSGDYNIIQTAVVGNPAYQRDGQRPDDRSKAVAVVQQRRCDVHERRSGGQPRNGVHSVQRRDLRKHYQTRSINAGTRAAPAAMRCRRVRVRRRADGSATPFFAAAPRAGTARRLAPPPASRSSNPLAGRHAPLRTLRSKKKV